MEREAAKSIDKNTIRDSQAENVGNRFDGCSVVRDNTEF